MITKWNLFNFKSVRDETELEFRPLTIFAGANSSGKSTILQSILLISQTLNSKVPSKSVILNGQLVQLGDFGDIKSEGGESDQITIGWKLDVPMVPLRKKSHSFFLIGRPTPYGQLFESECSISFDIKGSEQRIQVAKLNPELFTANLTARYKTKPGDISEFLLKVNRNTEVRNQENILFEDYNESVQTYAVEYSPSLKEATVNELPGAIPYTVALSHFLPEIVTYRYNSMREMLQKIINSFFRNSWVEDEKEEYDNDTEVPISVFYKISQSIGSHNVLEKYLNDKKEKFGDFNNISLYEIKRILSHISKEEELEMRKKLLEKDIWSDIYKLLLISSENKEELRKRSVPDLMRSPMKLMQDTFSKKFIYIGPLRAQPKSIYAMSTSSNPKDVGIRGENTSAVLELFKEEIISYIPSTQFKNPQIDPQPINRSLQIAVNDWLVYMDVANEVSTAFQGKYGYELKILSDGMKTPIDLTHVGVGVSQVLPILVSSLLSEPDTTLLFEQPELHLHPKVQTLLGDFFLSMSLNGKQCIIETHSEYLINRLRFRSAATDSKVPISNLMKIYFAERKQGKSSFRSVDVNEYGAISDWPEGFFDQSQDEAEQIIREATKKRKMKSISREE